MPKYPFDEKFNFIVKNLPEWQGDAWNMLINYSTDGPIFDSLSEAGYSADTVATYVSLLLAQPVDELLQLGSLDTVLQLIGVRGAAPNPPAPGMMVLLSGIHHAYCRH